MNKFDNWKFAHMETLNGAPVIARTSDAVYVRIPESMQRGIEGGCVCEYCTAHPDKPGKWDTLVVPADNVSDTCFTVHMPDPKTFRAIVERGVQHP